MPRQCHWPLPAVNPSRHRDRGGGLFLPGLPEHPGIAATTTSTGAFLGLSRGLLLRCPPIAQHQVAQRIARGESRLALVVGLVMVAHAIRIGTAVAASETAPALRLTHASTARPGRSHKVVRPLSNRPAIAAVLAISQPVRLSRFRQRGAAQRRKGTKAMPHQIPGLSNCVEYGQVHRPDGARDEHTRHNCDPRHPD